MPAFQYRVSCTAFDLLYFSRAGLTSLPAKLETRHRTHHLALRRESHRSCSSRRPGSRRLSEHARFPFSEAQDPETSCRYRDPALIPIHSRACRTDRRRLAVSSRPDAWTRCCCGPLVPRPEPGCRPTLTAVSPAILSLIGSCTSHICLPFTQSVRCGASPSTRRRNELKSSSFQTVGRSVAFAPSLTRMFSPNSAAVVPVPGRSSI